MRAREANGGGTPTREATALELLAEIASRLRAPRLDTRAALRVEEIAETLGVSRDVVYEHVLPNVRVLRLGRLRLVAPAELHRFVERNSSVLLEAERR